MKAHRQLTVVIKLGTQGIRGCQDHAADHSLCIGSSSIINEKTHQPILSILTLIVETAVKLHDDGHRVVIVSSGAIAVGVRRMDIEKKPKLLPRVQVSFWSFVRKPALNDVFRHWLLLDSAGS